MARHSGPAHLLTFADFCRSSPKCGLQHRTGELELGLRLRQAPNGRRHEEIRERISASRAYRIAPSEPAHLNAVLDCSIAAAALMDSQAGSRRNSQANTRLGRKWKANWNRKQVAPLFQLATFAQVRRQAALASVKLLRQKAKRCKVSYKREAPRKSSGAPS